MIEQILNNFKNFLEAKGWTKQKAANELGCSREHISRIINGQRNPSTTLLIKIEKLMESERNGR